MSGKPAIPPFQNDIYYKIAALRFHRRHIASITMIIQQFGRQGKAAALPRQLKIISS
jgi:hypothetical protein